MAANVIGNRVCVAFTTTGPGTYTFGSAASGYLTPAQSGVADGSRVSYVAVDSLTAPTTFEVGEGVYTLSGTTITRATIHRTSSGGTSAISWSAGTKYLFLAPAAERLLVLNSDGTLTIPSGATITSGGLTMTGTLAVTGAATVSSTLAVTGTATAADGTSGDQVVNYSQFTPVTKASPGTMTLPTGVIMKWGTGTATLGVGNITFSTAFPTACRNVQLTVAGGTGTGSFNTLYSGTITTAGFDVWGDAANTLGFHWLAIGD